MATKKPSPKGQNTQSSKQEFDSLSATAGNISTKDYAPVKTSGVQTRGNGAATKGKTARGPMA